LRSFALGGRPQTHQEKIPSIRSSSKTLTLDASTHVRTQTGDNELRTTTTNKTKNKTQDPNPDDPLNKEAAQRLRADARAFESLVQRSIAHGASIDGAYFPPPREA